MKFRYILLLALAGLALVSCKDEADTEDYTYTIVGTYVGQVHIRIPALTIGNEFFPEEIYTYGHTAKLTRVSKNRVSVDITGFQFPNDGELTKVGDIKVSNISVGETAGGGYYFVPVDSEVYLASPLSRRDIKTSGSVLNRRLQLEIGILGRVRSFDGNYGAEITFTGDQVSAN